MPFPVADADKAYQGVPGPAFEQAAASPVVPRETSGLPLSTASSGFRFKQRVRIVDGFPFRGSFHGVPDWVDRNWLNYESTPPAPYKAGPSILLPDGQRVRVGDWLVVEEVDGAAMKQRIYTDEQMQHFFLVEELQP